MLRLMARYSTFRDFWPFYLREHAQPGTRIMHYIGTTIGLSLVLYGLVIGKPVWLLGFPLAGYTFAWASHALIERNKPATFTYPLWSLAADLRMWALWITGRLAPHLARAGLPLVGLAPQTR